MVDIAGHSSARGRQTGRVGKSSYFRAKCVNISNTVGDTPKATNRKLHMRFLLALRLMTLDDLELP